jgi:hypothetical protein
LTDTSSAVEPENMASVTLQVRAGDLLLCPAAGQAEAEYQESQDINLLIPIMDMNRFMTARTKDIIRDAVLPEPGKWKKPSWLVKFEAMMAERRALGSA